MTTIRHEINVSATPDAAFQALTSQEGIEGWWAKDCDIGEGSGGEHELRFQKEGQSVHMRFRVEEASPGKQVTWRCVENGNPVWAGTTLSWKLESTGAGTSIDFSHSGFAEDQSPPYTMTVQGWQHFVGSLQAYLDGSAGQPF